jgi:hypothetical protein
LRDLDLVRPWPSGEPIVQQVEQAVESCIRDVHCGSLRSAVESQASAPVGGFGADLRPEPGQWMKIVLVLRWDGYRDQIKRTGPDEVKGLDLM